MVVPLIFDFNFGEVDRAFEGPASFWTSDFVENGEEGGIGIRYDG